MLYYHENPPGAWDQPRRRHQIQYFVRSGPNYKGNDGPFPSIEAALEAAKKRSWWYFIVTGGNRIVKYES